MTKKTTDEAQIHEMIQEWAEALHDKDATRMLSYYAPNLVHFSLAPPLLSPGSNAESIKAWLTAWFDTWQGLIDYEVHEVGIMVGDDVGFSHSLNRLQGRKTHGEKHDLWFRQTFGFQKIGGEWKIAHEHESVPFYMDGSVKAAIDLKP
jgi:ketosteroid isomerase-like protein